MAEQSPRPKSSEIQNAPPPRSGSGRITSTTRSGSGGSRKDTPDFHSMAAKLERAKEVYRAYEGHGEKPSIMEMAGWCFYELCSLSVLTVLIPVVFPLIISQISGAAMEPPQGWFQSFMGFDCPPGEMQLYQILTDHTIKISGTRFSPLIWTSISWALGLIIAGPILAFASFHLDYGFNQHLIAVGAVAAGALSCLPTGVFRTVKIFPLYIVLIVIAHSVAFTSHTRHLGLMLRGLVGPTVLKAKFAQRRTGSGLISSCSTAVGGLGAAAISAFTYHMLRRNRQEKEGDDNHFLSLWIVTIFGGLKWLLGIFHVFLTNRSVSVTIPSDSELHLLTIFKYPHAIGTVISAGFLSSFTTIAIFIAVSLFLIGQICFKPVLILYLWLIYFLIPLISLPLLHQFQIRIKADASKMQILGFILSAVTSAICFYFHNDAWRLPVVFVFAALQGTAAALLHTYGRVLVLDCSPAGKEAAISMWFSWMRAIGGCVGFTVAAVVPARLQVSSGVAFCCAVVGGVVLIYGNITDYGGAVSAGHVKNDSEKGSPVIGLESRSVSKELESP
ncbi:uncharacterized protein LOC111465229 isoform X1 [Cucurbita maxima]|uniref:Uncharacterized protein LOC111465229 isoform X1 n=1 Tax=Cucurbita maxima TaxID=3661 RepID=A0A6J1HK19_CUCMA|nr:uncharacterized protein LOC111465229 isoform X1 [Cucurbita maxima]